MLIMALDTLIGNLTVEKEGKREISDKYDSGLILNVVDNLFFAGNV